MDTEVETHPVQTLTGYVSEAGRLPKTVTMKAYEVYVALYGEQKAMVEGQCRGGFSTSEIIGFLYARSFPKAEWRDRVSEAWKGMKGIK